MATLGFCILSGPSDWFWFVRFGVEINLLDWFSQRKDSCNKDHWSRTFSQWQHSRHSQRNHDNEFVEAQKHPFRIHLVCRSQLPLDRDAAHRCRLNARCNGHLEEIKQRIHWNQRRSSDCYDFEVHSWRTTLLAPKWTSSQGHQGW